MKLQFIGVGSAFTTQKYYQSNMVLIAPSGKKLLIDCGGDARFALWEQGLNFKDIESVYISHLHGDHIGGLEWLALTSFFSKFPRPVLYTVPELMQELWETSLKGGLETIEGQVATLTTYFDCKPVKCNEYFTWEGWKFSPIQMVHVMSGYKIQHSYGLMMEPVTGPGKKVFLTTDTQYCPYQISKFYDQADLIFHDCETAPFKSGVHSHYDDLATLKAKGKMWLYHYQPEPKQDPVKDGFLGFVQKGQTFDLLS